MVFIFYLIALFGFVSGQIFRISLGNGLVIQLTDVLVCLAVICWISWSIVKRKFLIQLNHPFTKGILVFALVAVLSLAINSAKLGLPETLISSLYLIRWVGYACIFFVVKNLTGEQKKTVFRSLVISSTAIILLGYLQYMFYPNLRNLYYLGWDDHLYRLFSTILDPNFTAVIISLFIMVLFANSMTITLSWNKKTILTCIVLIISFIALLLTYSRGGFLAFAGGSIAIFILAKKKKYVYAVITILILGIIIIPKNLHSAGVELWRTASISARSESAQQALSIFIDHPVLGVGFDSYRYAQRQYGYAADTNWEISHSGGGTDNSLLFVLATTGIVGFSVYLFFWLGILNKIYKTYISHKSYTRAKILSLTFLASLITVFISSFFINSLFYPYILFWMWTLLGLIE